MFCGFPLGYVVVRRTYKFQPDGLCLVSSPWNMFLAQVPEHVGFGIQAMVQFMLLSPKGYYAIRCIQEAEITVASPEVQKKE